MMKRHCGGAGPRLGIVQEIILYYIIKGIATSQTTKLTSKNA